MKYLAALSLTAGIGLACATAKQEKLEGSVLNVPGQCLDYDAFDDDQHPDCRTTLGRGYDHAQDLDDFLGDVNVGEVPSSIPMSGEGNPYGSISQLRLPHVLITSPNDLNQACYDKSLAENPSLMSGECGYHVGVSAQDVENILLPDSPYNGKAVTIRAHAETATVTEGSLPEPETISRRTGDGIDLTLEDVEFELELD